MKLYITHILFLVGSMVLLPCCSGKGTKADTGVQTTTMEDSIESAIVYHLSQYPAAQYRDVYKFFMQDLFGPGHMLSDTAASRRYLMYELADTSQFEGPLFEPTGFRGNFYRVNLSLVKDSVIPAEVFFRSFVESLQTITPPTGDEWMKTWNRIDSVIKRKGANFPAEETDRFELMKQFNEGNYVVHHSQRFNDSVRFHYRIIARDKFESTILPYIQSSDR